MRGQGGRTFPCSVLGPEDAFWQCGGPCELRQGPQGWQAPKPRLLMSSEAYSFDQKCVPCRLSVLCWGWLPPAPSGMMGLETRMLAALCFLAWGLCWPSRLFACDIQSLGREPGFHLPGARDQWLLGVTHGLQTQWKPTGLLSSERPGIPSSLFPQVPALSTYRC